MEPQQEQPEFRIKVPRNKEVLGFIEQRLGGSRMRVRCLDGKTRICRVPGKKTMD
jgi:translation initiation factor 1A